MTTIYNQSRSNDILTHRHPHGSNHLTRVSSTIQAFVKVDGRLPGGNGGGKGVINSNDDDDDGYFDNRLMYQSQGIIFGMNLLGFAISRITPTTHYHVDLLGTSAFGIAAAYGYYYHTRHRDSPGISNDGNKSMITNGNKSIILSNSSLDRIRISSLAVITWSTKLASFLLYRVIYHGGHDARLDRILAERRSSAGFWFISALWGCICSLPHSIGTTSKVPDNNTTVQPISRYGGISLYSIGLIIETVADYQKWIFKQTHTSSEFCNVGLWSYSQHPNWFGNIVLWFGIFLINAPALIDPSSSTSSNNNSKCIEQESTFPLEVVSRQIIASIWRYRRIITSLFGPLFLLWLFDGEANGRLLPETYEGNLKKYGYGTNPSFTNYINTTPKLFPSFKFW